MSVTGYVSTGAFFDTGLGISRIHGEIDYTVSRTDNTVYFTSTYARAKHVRESGTWTSWYYGAGWTWKVYIDNYTFRVSSSASGTRYPGSIDWGNAANFSIGVASDTSTISAKVGAYFSGDAETSGSLTIYVPTVSAPSGQSVWATNIASTTVTLNASVSNWGNNCTAGTGQRIEYKKSTDSTWTNLAYSTATSHSRNITGLTPGATYNLRTWAINGAGLSSNSDSTTFTMQSGVKVITTGGVEDRIIKSISPAGTVTTCVATKIV